MIIFRNKGLIDLAAVRTLGVSVKEEGAIGYFGTGVKFAISTILRGGGSVSLFRGKQEHRFGVIPEEVRGKSFDIVTLDGQPLGFTTALGRDWKPWMAFRELACNALDEGGRYYVTADFEGAVDDDETLFIVHDETIEDAYHARGEIILESTPIYANDIIEIRPGPTRSVYYRGVNVGELPRPSAYCYNLLRKIDLTEDRTAKYFWETASQIQQGLLVCEDEELLFNALSCGRENYEHHLTFSATTDPSEAFLKVAAGLRGRLDDIVNANPSAMAMAKMRKLSELGPAESIPLGAVERSRFERAKAFLTRAGYDMERYPIMVVDDLGSGVYGLAKEERIFIAKAAFQKGTKEVASTLLEEWVHLRTGYGDMTRELQTWLFDELLSQVEEAAGEAM